MLDPTTAPNMPLEPATHNSQIEDEDDDEDDYEADGARLLAPCSCPVPFPKLTLAE